MSSSHQLRIKQNQLKRRENELKGIMKEDWMEIKEGFKPQNIAKEVILNWIVKRIVARKKRENILTQMISNKISTITQRLFGKT